MLRRFLIAFLLGIIIFGHRWYGGQWWTDVYDYEFPGIYTYLYSIPGYWPSPW